MSVSPEQLASTIRRDAKVHASRENVSRAKQWVLNSEFGIIRDLREQWLAAQNASINPNAGVDTRTAEWEGQVEYFARATGLCFAFFQAVTELLAAGEVLSSGQYEKWELNLQYRSHHHSSGIPYNPSCDHPVRIAQPLIGRDVVADIDIFLMGDGCKSLHPGVREAINQSLGCYRRGLYMPAIVMLAAAVEATWAECATAMSSVLNDKKLKDVVADSYAGIAKLVKAVVLAIDSASGKSLLEKAQIRQSDVRDVEVWTTAIRDRRNALHWNKSNSFIVDHGEVGTLLMMAPVHIATLEALRTNC